MGPTLGAVAADAEEDVNLLIHKRINNQTRLLVPARAAEDSPAQVMDALDMIRCEFDRRQARLGMKSLITKSDSRDFSHTIIEVQFENQSSNHVIDARTQAAASDDRSLGFGRLKKDLFSGSGTLKR